MSEPSGSGMRDRGADGRRGGARRHEDMSEPSGSGMRDRVADGRRGGARKHEVERGDIMKRDIERGRMHAADNGTRCGGNKMKNANGRVDIQNGRGGAVRMRKAASVALMFVMVFCLTLGLMLSGGIFAIPSADAAVNVGVQWFSFENSSSDKLTKVVNKGFSDYNKAELVTNESGMSNKHFYAPAGLRCDSNNIQSNGYYVGYIDFRVSGSSNDKYTVKAIGDFALYASSGAGQVWTHAGARMMVTDNTVSSMPSELYLPDGSYYTSPREALHDTYGGDSASGDFEKEAPNGQWTLMYAYGNQSHKHFGIGSVSGTDGGSGLPARISSPTIEVSGGSVLRVWVGMCTGNDQEIKHGMSVAVCTGMGYSCVPSNNQIQTYGDRTNNDWSISQTTEVTQCFSSTSTNFNIPQSEKKANGNTYYYSRCGLPGDADFNSNKNYSWSSAFDFECNDESNHHKYGMKSYKPTSANAPNDKTYGIQIVARGQDGNLAPIEYCMTIPLTLRANHPRVLLFSADLVAGIISETAAPDKGKKQSAVSSAELNGAKFTLSTSSSRSDAVLYTSPTLTRGDTKSSTMEAQSIRAQGVSVNVGSANTVYIHLYLKMDKNASLDGSDSWNCATVCAAAFVTNISLTTQIKSFQGYGTEANPYKLTNRTDFDVLRSYVNSDGESFGDTYFLVQPYDNKNINFTPNTVAPVNKQSFTPIGGNGRDQNQFSGNLDGNNKTLQNVYIDQGIMGVGLFGTVNAGTYKNLTFENINIPNESGHSVGALIGRIRGDNVTIDNVDIGAADKTSGTINGSREVGGVVGTSTNAFTVKNCDFYASISISANRANAYIAVGGIVGYANPNITIENCKNYGTVMATAATTHDGSYGVGGIFGQGTATIKNCENTTSGYVHGASGVGGIAGHINGGSISGCTNAGCVYASSIWNYSGSNNGAVVGGIAGYSQNTNISNCCSLNSTQSGNNVNGAVGYYGGAHSASDSKYYTHDGDTSGGRASAYGSSDVEGGIAGILNGGTISYCYVSSLVFGGNKVGGIVGYLMGDNANKSIEFCFADNIVNRDWDGPGASYGAIVGYADNPSQNKVQGSWALTNSGHNVDTYTWLKMGKTLTIDRTTSDSFPSISAKKSVPVIYTAENGYVYYNDWSQIKNYNYNAVAAGHENDFDEGTYLYATQNGDETIYTPQTTNFTPDNGKKDLLTFWYAGAGDDATYTIHRGKIGAKNGEIGKSGVNWKKSSSGILNHDISVIYQPDVNYRFEAEDFDIPSDSNHFKLTVTWTKDNESYNGPVTVQGVYNFEVIIELRESETATPIGGSGRLKGTVTINAARYCLDCKTVYTGADAYTIGLKYNNSHLLEDANNANDYALFTYPTEDGGLSAASYCKSFPEYGTADNVGLVNVAFWQTSGNDYVWFEFKDEDGTGQAALDSSIQNGMLCPNEPTEDADKKKIARKNFYVVKGSLIKSEAHGAGNNCYFGECDIDGCDVKEHTIYIGPEDSRVKEYGYAVGYYYYVAFETADENIKFIVGTGNKKEVRRLEILYRIEPKELTVTPTPETWNDDTFTYINDVTGVTQLAFAGFENGETLGDFIDATTFTRTSTHGGEPADATQPTVNGNNVNFATIEEGIYTYNITLSDKSNYKFGDIENPKQPVFEKQFSWTINPKDIGTLQFAYGPGGEVAGNAPLTIDGYTDASYYGLYASATAGDGKYALVFMDSGNVYSGLANYVLLWAHGDNPNPAGDGALRWLNYMSTGINFAFATGNDYVANFADLTYTPQGQNATEFGTALGGNTDVMYVYIKLTGEGNFEGELYVRFALMKHDFGGWVDGTSAWGDNAHPYLIESEAHFIRLSQIVNGARAWDSIHSADKTVALGDNDNAVATSRDYAGAYFKVSAPGETISVSTAHGFEPIGHIDGEHTIEESNQKFPFKADFDGGYDDGSASGAKINLTIGSDSVGYIPSGSYKGYVGLFGYVSGAYDGTAHTGAHIHDLWIDGGTIYTSADYVGAIAGFAEKAMFSGQVVTRATITNKQSQKDATNAELGFWGKYTGGAIGYMLGGEIAYDKNQFLANRVAETSAIAVNGYEYVGGLFGMLDGVKFAVSAAYKPSTVFTNVMLANVSGNIYVGGIAGEWIIPTLAPSGDPAQGTAEGGGNYVNFVNLTVGRPSDIGGTGTLEITGITYYIGGIAGHLKDSKPVGGTYTTVTDGGLIVPNLINVKLNIGTYLDSKWATYMVGGAFGSLEGNGFAYTGNDTANVMGTVVRIIPDHIKVTVNIQSASPYLVGGLFGYVSGTGVLFDGDFSIGDSGRITFSQTTYTGSSNSSNNNSASDQNSFVGGIAGVIGQNATLERNTNIEESGSDATIIANQALSGSFVGGIAGFVTFSAGVKPATDEKYLFGNGIGMRNTEQMNEKGKGDFVGGLFGAMGYVGVNILSSELQTLINNNVLRNILPNGNLTEAAANTGFTFGGKALSNTGDIYGNNYVGGLIGYVGEYTEQPTTLTVIQLTNAQIAANKDATDLTVYANSHVDGNDYVGGMFGYVGDAAHGFVRMYFEGSVTASGDYVGGLFGSLENGTVRNSVAIASTDTGASYTTLVNSAGNYAGGIAGYLGGNQNISDSFTAGFPFDDEGDAVHGVSPTRGGLVGGVGNTAGVASSWTFYYSSKMSGTTTSPNQKGKYVLIDASLRNAAGQDIAVTAKALMAMAGVIDTTSEGAAAVTGGGIIEANAAKQGHVSFAAAIPADESGSARDKQLALYEANGKGQTTKNNFEVLTNNKMIDGKFVAVYFKFDAASSNSMVVASEEIIYKDMKPDKTGEIHSETVPYAEAKAYYYPPAYDASFYTIQEDVTNSTMTHTYGADGNVTNVNGHIYGQETIPANSSSSKRVVLGYMNRDYKPGEADSPYIISDITEWRNFATNIKNRALPNPEYKSSYFKQTADITDITVNDLAGNGIKTEGSYINAFKGTYDGGGHSLTVTGQFTQTSSLFPYAGGSAGSPAVIKNLTVKGEMNTETGSAEVIELAAFVSVPGGDIVFENCVNEANITASKIAGGFVARTGNNTVTMVSCVNKGTIYVYDNAAASYTGESENGSYRAGGTGGLVGLVEKSMTLESCKNEGAVSGGFNVGGLVGGVFILNDATSTTQIDINVYNSANTGKVTAHSASSTESDAARLKMLNYVGGLIGKTGAHSKLTMLASYNSGNVIAYGNIAGGLVGGVGEITYGEGNHGIIINQGGKNIIAYCYNSGKVEAGGTTSKSNSPTSDAILRVYGTVTGGIAGCAGWVDVNYCYNTGEIWNHGYAYAGDYRTASGGIIGESEPCINFNDNPNTCHDDGQAVNFNYCYNVGLIINDCQSISTSSQTFFMFGGPITGYTAQNGTTGRNEIGRVSVNNCYALEGCLVTTSPYNRYQVYDSNTCTAFRTPLDTKGNYTYVYTKCANIKFVSLDGLTAIMGTDGQAVLKDSSIVLNNENVSSGSNVSTLLDASGTYRAQYNESTHSSNYGDVPDADDDTGMAQFMSTGTLPGYIFIPGCLPQLAVFALDTKEGLSMLSTSFGRKSVGGFTTDYVGAQAGSEYSPYIVKDGIDLMGLAALVNASGEVIERDSNGTTSESSVYHHFADKYIQIANGIDNNIGGVDVASVNMTSYKYSTTAQGAADGTGKSYHLYDFNGNSAVGYYRGNAAAAIAANDISMHGPTWAGNNQYYDGSAYKNGFDASKRNFLPIGLGDNNYFAGNFDGVGATIVGLNVVQAEDLRAYAGLFAKVQQGENSVTRASVAGITLSDASVTAYLTSATSAANTGAVAGGIVAWLGGGTTVERCTVGGTILSTLSTGVSAPATAEGNPKPAIDYNTYVGGIAGLITSATAYAGDTAGAGKVSYDSVILQNCSVMGANISGWGVNIGGIAGIATGYPFANAYLPDSALTSAHGDINIQALQQENGSLLPNKVGGGTTLQNVKAGSDGTLAHDHAGGGIGGVVGVTNGDVNVTISSSIVSETATDTVTIVGTHMVGGIVGRSNGNTIIGVIDGAGVTVGAGATINITTTDENHTDDNGTHDTSDDVQIGTAVGGIVGYAVQNTVFVYVTFGGTLNVGGTVPASNIGGVVGFMGRRSAFYNGARVVVNGTIKVNILTTESSTVHNQNIGGVIGYTRGATIRGTFDVTPIIGSDEERNDAFTINVGGFIGNVAGPVYISSLSDTVKTTINISTESNKTGRQPKIMGGKFVGGFAGYISGQGGVYVGLVPESETPCLGDVKIKIGNPEDLQVVNPLQNAFIITAVDYTFENVGDDVGGFIGRNNGTLHFEKGKMQNYAIVVGYNDVGGIIGHNSGSFTVGGEMELENYGDVYGNMMEEFPDDPSGDDRPVYKNGKYIGGIIGNLEHGTLIGTFTNYGNVTGVQYVGGAIGIGQANATITVEDGKDTKTSFTNYGVVTGVQYVGGSIGWMEGIIQGKLNGTFISYVEFVNTTTTPTTPTTPTVPGGSSSSDALVAEGGEGVTSANGTGQLTSPEGLPANYFGGAIGVLNGSASYARFANSVAMTISASANGGLADKDHTGKGGSWGIGGSIGIIGMPGGTSSAVINNCQFEFFKNNNTDSEEKPILTIKGAKGETGIVANGVGGAIGIIAPGVSFAASNNFFLGGEVRAEQARFVGGAVGLIRANDVKIKDVLIFSNVVEGYDYVGGVVGSVGWVDLKNQSANTPVANEGLRVSILNSFNLKGTVISKGEAATRGGIVGYSLDKDVSEADATDASTSYWVVDKLRDAEGNVNDLTSDFIQQIVDSGRWSSGATDETYNTGSTNKGWYFMFAQDGALIMPGDTQTNGVHTTADGAPGVNIFHVLQQNARFPYWQAIAGVKTFNQLNGSAPILEYKSFIIGKENKTTTEGYETTASTVTNGGQPKPGVIYVAASAGINGKYLTVSSTSKPSGFVTYLHDTVGAGQPETASLTGDDYIPEGGYGYTYIAVNVSDKPGNVAVYYRDLVKKPTAQEGEGSSEDFVPSVTAKAAPYSGKANDVIIPSESSVEGGVAYPEFANMNPLQEKGGTAGTYAYSPHLTSYTAIGKTVPEEEVPTQIINSGFYEGYLNIYLYDENGTPKAVGSVKFGMEVAPREVRLAINKTNTHDYVGAVENDNNQYASTAFKFQVKDGDKYVDWAVALSGEDNPTNEQLQEPRNKVKEYIDSFGIKFMYNNKVEETILNFDLKKPTDNAYGTMHALVNADLRFQISRMMYLGEYIMNMYPSTNNSVYSPMVYQNGKWAPNTDSDAPTYIATKDGNYYMAGNGTMDVDIDPQKSEENLNSTHNIVVGTENSIFTKHCGQYNEKLGCYQFTFYEIVQNEFTAAWHKNEKTYYNGQTDGSDFEILTLVARSGFVNKESIESEIDKATVGVIGKGGNLSQTPQSFASLITNKTITYTTEEQAEKGWTTVHVFITFDKNAGSYTADFADGQTAGGTDQQSRVFSDNTTYVMGEDSEAQGTFELYQMIIKPNVTYTQGEPNYTYNAEQQGASKIDFVQNSTNGALPFAITASDVKTFEFTGGNDAYRLNSGKYLWDKDDVSKDVGKYSVTITLNSNSNYTFNTNASSPTVESTSEEITWTIGIYEINVTMGGNVKVVYNGAAHQITVTATHDGQQIKVSFNQNDGTYSVSPFADKDSSSITFSPTYMQGSQSDVTPVNAGSYEVGIDDTNISYNNGTNANKNYSVKLGENGSGHINIDKAMLQVVWDGNSVVYNGAYQGKPLGVFKINNNTNPENVGNLKIEQKAKYRSMGVDGRITTFVVTVHNCYGSDETLNIGVSGININAGQYIEQVNNQVSSCGGDNAAHSVLPTNYTIVQAADNSYNITQKHLDWSISGQNFTKTYDGDVDVEIPGTVTFNGVETADAGKITYTVTATYNNANVGKDKPITYTVTLDSDVPSKNYTLNNPTNTSYRGEITPKQLTVKLNLRSGVATKIYDGNTSYGGSGFSGNANGQSSPNRVGNGFTVSGFVGNEQDTYAVTAEFEETGNGRSAYNAFVNNIGLIGEETSNKRLVFTLNNKTNDGVLNYTLVLDDSHKSTFNGEGRTDSDGKAYSLTVTSDIATAITITKKTIKPEYANTAQSYANPDNTYNTNWEDVKLSASDTSIVSNDKGRVSITVNNGWRFANGTDGDPMQYTQHTVIRGVEGNSRLGAQLESTASESAPQADKDAYLNYTLAQQPTLVIGYFVYQNNAEFKIGSLASLLIAAYYYSISGEGGPFDVIAPTTRWVPVCSADDYNNNTNPPDGYGSWAAYIDALALPDGPNGGNHVAFPDETTGEWGYLVEDTSAEKPTYTQFKLVDNIKGVFTDLDIKILEGMFHITLDGKNYDWGYGTGEFGLLKNVLKAQVGDAVTILNSLFGDFTGTFDGNGYVIDGLNIMGGISITGQSGEDYKTNAGFFAEIGSGATVSDLHLRNLNLVANNVANVGGLAGTALADVSNVSVHGMFNVTGGTNLGGVIGVLGHSAGSVVANLSNVIALGTIYAHNVAVVGGVVGVNTGEGNGNIKSAVSMMYVWSTHDVVKKAVVGGIVGGGRASESDYLQNSIWLDGKSNAESDGANRSDYKALHDTSVSGYGSTNQYYLSTSAKGGGGLDVIDESKFTLDNHSLENDKPRESMRLCDIIDVYLLQYSLTETTANDGGKNYNVYTISKTSWLVGTAKGTDDSPIIIANQQGVSLLRELRFATFKLTADVYMYSTYELTTFKGAFFGKIYNSKDGNTYDENGYHIYIKDYDGTTHMFEQYAANGVTIPLKKYE